tara:strand:- start:4 stop:327 length:324 start_codon:yes stop_codon:yes gene_type:complete
MDNMPDGFSWEYRNMPVSKNLEHDELIELFTQGLNEFVSKKAAGMTQTDWSLPDKYEKCFPLTPSEVERVFGQCAEQLATSDPNFSSAIDIEWGINMDYYFEVEVQC